MSIESFSNGTPRVAVTGVAMHTIVSRRRRRRLTLVFMLAGVLLGADHAFSYASFGNLAKLQLNK